MPGPSHKFQFPQNALYRDYDDVLEPSDVENMVVSSGGQRNSLWKQQKKLCKRSRSLFEDPYFPADMSSCFRTRRPASDFLWKRPRDIVKNPKMFTDGASRFDITQGKLGDCWLLASLACLSLHDDLFHHVVPKDQEFDDPDYCGCFRFYFWTDGEWKEVLIDDRLPTYKGELVFVHSRDSNEFWSALVEKAYAKLFGCYEALMGGSIEEGLADFTGGITEQVDLQTDGTVEEIYAIINKAFSRKSLMGCSIPAESRKDIESKLDNGLVRGHAYSITGLVQLERRRGRRVETVRLIRARNPWGAREWNGAWSDESEEWRSISEREKQQLNLVSDEDGEFWMSFEDFCREFKNVSICHQQPEEEKNELRRESVKKRWFVEHHDSQWTQASAGGCRNFKDTFTKNPQFRVTLVDVDEEDDDDLCTMVVSLMQKKSRGIGIEKNCIGLAVYAVDNDAPSELDLDYVLYHKQVARSKSFTDSREIVLRARLPPGEYCIIPSTHEPNKYGQFLLRIYTEQAVTSKECDDETGGEINYHDFTNEQLSTAEMMADKFDDLAGPDKRCDVFEMKQVLDEYARVNGKSQEDYSLETCRNLMCMFDTDASGSLDNLEFIQMWKFICQIQKTFLKYDEDNSGTLSAFELRGAIKSLGASLSHKIIGKLVLRYAGKDGCISFNDFLSISAKVSSCLAACAEFQVTKDRPTQVTMNQLINFALYT